MGGMLLTGLVDRTDDLAVLDTQGFWAVLVPFDGSPVCARFAERRPVGVRPGRRWTEIGADVAWTTSMDRQSFVDGVGAIRSHIAAGNVYQVNLTRRLQASLPNGSFDPMALHQALKDGNPAPYGSVLAIPEEGVAVVSASPERFLTRSGRTVRSSPIKGTAARRGEFLDKDFAENVMIVDLVRNDLGRVCEWGSVTAPVLCAVEEHPGLVHLVSTVQGRLRPDVGWPELLDATFPPGSVTGAPKCAALGLIADIEPVPRGPYCGAMGWVDADRATADLAVAIRTFWWQDGALCYGTGGGITWGSDPLGEWAETELKAANLTRIVGGAR